MPTDYLSYSVAELRGWLFPGALQGSAVSVPAANDSPFDQFAIRGKSGGCAAEHESVGVPGAIAVAASPSLLRRYDPFRVQHTASFGNISGGL